MVEELNRPMGNVYISHGPWILEVFEAIGAELKEATEEDSVVDLSGVPIMIHTLTESAGTRAKSVLESMFPSAKVRVQMTAVYKDKLKVWLVIRLFRIGTSKRRPSICHHHQRQSTGKNRLDFYPGSAKVSSVLSPST